MRAKLRRESGAVIAREEAASEVRTYFPMPGDSPEVIRQKADARRAVSDVMASEGQRALDLMRMQEARREAARPKVPAGTGAIPGDRRTPPAGFE